MMYEKQILIPKRTVAGNIRDYKQQYEIFYYPKAGDLLDKVAIYIYLVGNKQFAKRSIYFSSHEQLKDYILDLIDVYFKFRDKRIKPIIPLLEFRKISLQSFIEKLETRQRAIWGNSK